MRYVPAEPVFFKVTTPDEAMVASPDIVWVTQFVPLAMSMFPDVTAVEPKGLPLILPTTVAPCVPVTSPEREPVKLVEVAIEIPVIEPPVIFTAFAF